MADEGQSGSSKIAKFSKGDKARTARHAEVMNELVDAINAIRNGKVAPTGFGRFLFSDSNMILDLNKLQPVLLRTMAVQVCVDGDPQTVNMVVSDAEFSAGLFFVTKTG